MHYKNEAEVTTEIDTILRLSGYGKSDIQREVLVNIYAGRKRKKCRADYVILVDGKKRFILEAKSSRVAISNEHVIGQAKSYAMNLQIEYFAICNGKFFSFYETKNTQEPLWSYRIYEVDKIQERISRHQFKPEKSKDLIDILKEGDFDEAAERAMDHGIGFAKKKIKDWMKGNLYR